MATHIVETDGPVANSGAGTDAVGAGAPADPPVGTGAPADPPVGTGAPADPPVGAGAPADPPVGAGAPADPPVGAGAGTSPLGATHIVPAVLPHSPLAPPAGYVIINIPICIPVSCLPPSGLSPAAGVHPNLSVASNPVIVPGIETVHPTCEVQINNLVDMQISEGGPNGRKKLVALEALKEWKEAQSGLEGKVERRTKQTDKLIYEIYQLVGLYSVFVGVVFTATLQSQSVRCQHIWSPVLLCVVAWLIIILVTIKRLKRYHALRVTIRSEGKARAAVYGQISKLKSFGHKGFDFTKHVEEKYSTESTKSKSTYRVCGIRLTASRVIPIVLTALTLILVGSFIHIMCLEDITSRS